MDDKPHEELKQPGSPGDVPPPIASPSENYVVTEQLQQMPNVFARGLLYIVGLLLVVALVYSLVGTLDVVIECRALVRPVSDELKILSDEELSYASRIDELEFTIPLQAEQYDNKIVSVREELQNLSCETTNRLALKRLELDQNRMALKSAESDLSYWRKEEDSYSQEFANTEKLFNKRLTSIGEYNAIRSQLERARTEVLKLGLQTNVLAKKRGMIESDIMEAKAVATNRRDILENEMANRRLEKTTTLQSMQSELALSRKMLSMKDGAFRKPDRSSLHGTLRAPHPLYMQITVANKDIGLVEPGMPIKYKFDAFPYADYGTMGGEVSAVSLSAVEDPVMGYVYHVRGALDEVSFQVNKKERKECPVKAGMTATAELVTERKKIFSIVIGKLKK